MRALLVGDAEAPLRGLVSDVLADLEIDLPEESAKPDLVIVFIRGGRAAQVVSEARRVARGAPIVGLLPFGDESLLAYVRREGVERIHALDRSLQALAACVRAALA